MRYVLVSSRHHPGQGGIGAYVAAFVEAGARHGWRIDLITRPGAHAPRGAVVHAVETADRSPAFARRLSVLRELEVVRPYRYGLWSLAAARKLLELNERPDAIEFVDSQAEGYVSLCSARVRVRYAGVPMIVHAHTTMAVVESLNRSDDARFGRGIYHAWERAALEAADAIIAPSARASRTLAAGSTVVRVPPPVRGATPGGRVRSKRIVVLGTIEPAKGVDIWCRSLNTVLRERPDAEALLVGPDTSHGPDGASCAACCRDLLAPALRGRLRITGPVAYPDAVRILNRAALVVVPSLHESFSYVAADAVVRRRPVLLSDRVGLHEYAPQLEVYPADDQDALALAQLRALDDPAGGRSRVDAARRHLLRSCSPSRHIAAKRRLIERLNCRETRYGRARADDAIDLMESFLRSVEARERVHRVSAQAPSPSEVLSRQRAASGAGHTPDRYIRAAHT